MRQPWMQLYCLLTCYNGNEETRLSTLYCSSLFTKIEFADVNQELLVTLLRYLSVHYSSVVRQLLRHLITTFTSRVLNLKSSL